MKSFRPWEEYLWIIHYPSGAVLYMQKEYLCARASLKRKMGHRFDKKNPSLFLLGGWEKNTQNIIFIVHSWIRISNMFRIHALVHEDTYRRKVLVPPQQSMHRERFMLNETNRGVYVYNLNFSPCSLRNSDSLNTQILACVCAKQFYGIPYWRSSGPPSLNRFDAYPQTYL